MLVFLSPFRITSRTSSKARPSRPWDSYVAARFNKSSHFEAGVVGVVDCEDDTDNASSAILLVEGLAFYQAKRGYRNKLFLPFVQSTINFSARALFSFVVFAFADADVVRSFFSDSMTVILVLLLVGFCVDSMDMRGMK